MYVDGTMRIMIGMVVASTIACGPDAGDDEDSAADASGDGSSSASTGATDDGASSADEAATTSSTGDDVDDSTSDAMASSDDTSTGSPCDAGCESLDEATCSACPDCSTISGTPWETDPQGQPCLGQEVYLGCQFGVCAGQTNTFCDGGGAAYQIDWYCYEDGSSSLEPCEPPIDTYPTC
jgi:hypothetical protein